MNKIVRNPHPSREDSLVRETIVKITELLLLPSRRCFGRYGGMAEKWEVELESQRVR